MMRTMILAGLVLAAAAAAARADIAPQPGAWSGATLETWAKDVTVAMVWEEVDLYPALDHMAVKAVFGMKNTGPTDVTLEVGFPEFRGQAWYGRTEDQPLEDFAVTVDGKPVTGIERLVPPKEARPAAARGRGKPSDPKTAAEWVARRGLGAWRTWTMDFPRGVERRVEVAYRTAPAVRPHDDAKGLAPEVADRVAWRSNGYLLWTGAPWAGNIGKATVRIHYGDGLPKSLVRSLRPPWHHWRAAPPPSPWTYDEKTRTDTAVFKDFEPKYGFDVEFGYKAVPVAGEVDLLVAALRGGADFGGGHYSLQRLALMIEGAPEDMAGADGKEKLMYVYGRYAESLDREVAVLESRARQVLGPLMSYGPAEGLYAADGFAVRALKALVAHHDEAGRKGEALAEAGRLDRLLSAAAAYWQARAEVNEKHAAEKSVSGGAGRQAGRDAQAAENARRCAAESREKLRAVQAERTALAAFLKANGKPLAAGAE